MDLSTVLAAAIQRGVRAISENRPHDAVADLRLVAEDPAFQEADDFADIRARVYSLLAQAQFHSGDLAMADQWIQRALRTLRVQPDPRGLQQVRELQTAIVTSIAEDRHRKMAIKEQKRLAEIPSETFLESLKNPGCQLDRMLKKANADLRYGDPESGIALAKEVVRTATDPRNSVLAMITLARAEPQTAATTLCGAFEVAQRHEEIQLVALVANAAKELGVQLPMLEGPECA